jgi:hypothetical protein
LHDNYLEQYRAMLKWQDLADAIADYRDSGISIPDKKLWEPLLEEHALWSLKNGSNKVLKTLPPVEMTKEHPFVEGFNKFAESLGARLITKGAKSYYSLMRKIEDPKFDGNPQTVFDTIRFTYAVTKVSGTGFLVENIKEFSKLYGEKATSENWSLSKGFYLSMKVNASTGISVVNEAGEVKPRSIVGEIKFAEDNQIDVKDLADKLYHIRRRLQPEGSGGRKMLDLADPTTNEEKLKSIHKHIKTFISNRKVAGVIKKFGENIELPDFETFSKDQKKFDKVYEGLERLERLIFIDALGKADVSFKKLAYKTFKEQMKEHKERDESGKMVTKKPDFDDKDFEIFKKAYTREELQTFERELEAKAQKNKAHGKSFHR